MSEVSGGGTNAIANAELVKRSRSELLALLDDYWLLEIDKNLVG